jgi:hypothetical protein
MTTSAALVGPVAVVEDELDVLEAIDTEVVVLPDAE